MRTIWNGSISFGLVNIPVGLALATTPKAKQSDVSFRTLHRECKTPIRQKRWCPTHEREVGPDEIVKGWEVAKGEFVIVDDADLEAIAQHDESRSIDITRFVELDVRSQAEIDEAVAGTEVKPAELKLAQQVMESLVAEFDPEELHSQYRSDLRQLLEAKLDGQEIAKPEPVPETPVVDLMEALKRSVEEVKGRKTTAKAASTKKKAAPKSGSSGARRQPARKSA